MKKKIDELIKAVLDWWEKHQYDVECSDDEEYNLYDETPEFVELAKKLKGGK